LQYVLSIVVGTRLVTRAVSKYRGVITRYYRVVERKDDEGRVYYVTQVVESVTQSFIPPKGKPFARSVREQIKGIRKIAV